MRRKESLRKSLAIQFHVMHALYIREMISHFGRHNIGFLWMFVEPMMFSVGIAVLWTLTGASKGVIAPAGFALTGYSAIVAWRSCVGRTAIAIKANKGLLYHRNITVFDLAFTRAFFEFSAVTVSFFTLSIIFINLDLISYPVDLIQVILAWALLGWFFICAGLVALYLDQRSELFERIWHVMMYLTLPLTGAFTMVSWLPKNVQQILLLSPMVNGVEMLREGFFGVKINAQYSLTYLIMFNIVFSLVALLLTSKVKKLIESD